MSELSTAAEFLDVVRKSGIYTPDGLDAALRDVEELPADPNRAAAVLVKCGVLTPFQAKNLLAGKYRGFRFGPYVIRAPLGRGGMGVVYLAEHPSLHRPAAIKVLTAGDADHRVAVERFLREARAAAALDHPNIVRIFDIGRQGDIHYLAMEYVDGQTLGQLIKTGGALSCGRAVEYVAQAAAGLQHAYEKGFVHRDIKPDNLMLTRDGTVKVLDMGLARSTADTDRVTEVWDAGAVVGTSDFIAPEQAMSNAVDIRADIYSLGATLFALLAGRPPFNGTTAQKLLQHQVKPAPNLSSVDKTFPPGLSEVVSKALAKRPADRYQTPAQLITALTPWLNPSGKLVAGLSSTGPSGGEQAMEAVAALVTGSTTDMSGRARTEPSIKPEPGRRKRPLVVAAAAAAVVAVLAAGGLVAALTSGGGPRPGAAAAVEPAAPQPGAPLPPAPPQPQPEPTAGYRVAAGPYDVELDAAGISRLRVAGQDFLRSLTVYRGAYFYQGSRNAALVFPAFTRSSPTVFLGDAPEAAVRYEFLPDRIVWTVTNKQPGEGMFFVILNGQAIQAVCSDAGEWAGPLVKRDWPNSTWYAGRAKLKVTGASLLRGAWTDLDETCQVCQLNVPGNATRTLTLEPGEATPAEADRAAKAAAGPAAPAGGPLGLTAPRDMQVFQRTSRATGWVGVAGRAPAGADRVEVRLEGRPLEGALPAGWQPIALAPADGTFDTRLPTPAGGWYKVTVRASAGDRVLAEEVVPKVGVGEVFVGAGQSNSTNYGAELTRPTSDLVSSFDGQRWAPAADPQPGTHDRSVGGSFWPALGDALAERYKVPIGLAVTGHGPSATTEWRPGAELFEWTARRMKQLGPDGFRAVLWHQGESDAGLGADQYAANLTAAIEGSHKVLGRQVPWFVAQVSYLGPDRPKADGVRAGQKLLWDRGVALEGPDTDALTGDHRDRGGLGVHFSAKGLRAHGRAWGDKVSVYLDRVLAAP
ncbi:protein kinase [Gemmata sp. JC717]|uniref:protein kinase domain-containing protein n=1 Tax=Gemmata algarum TaxID=2975278 RepID=UPI0021BB21B5|nr:protein kinase [Gemmata algarum]MDY3551166.1 protein kinase [Gemmata algarum]